MEKIVLEFSATPSLSPANGVVVVLTLDDKGKSYKAKFENDCNIALHSFFVVTLSTSSHLRTMSSHGPIQNSYLLNARMSAMVFRLCSIFFPTFST